MNPVHIKNPIFPFFCLHLLSMVKTPSPLSSRRLDRTHQNCVQQSLLFDAFRQSREITLIESYAHVVWMRPNFNERNHRLASVCGLQIFTK